MESREEEGRVSWRIDEEKKGTWRNLWDLFWYRFYPINGNCKPEGPSCTRWCCRKVFSPLFCFMSTCSFVLLHLRHLSLHYQWAHLYCKPDSTRMLLPLTCFPSPIYFILSIHFHSVGWLVNRPYNNQLQCNTNLWKNELPQESDYIPQNLTEDMWAYAKQFMNIGSRRNPNCCDANSTDLSGLLDIYCTHNYFFDKSLQMVYLLLRGRGGEGENGITKKSKLL